MASDSIVIFDDKEVMGLFSEKISNLKVSDDVFRCLVDQGIIIPDNLDEDLRLSIVRQNQITNPDKELKIAINTTYGCNARCKECIYMPICQAGCKGFRSLNNPLVSPCVNEKYYIDTILKYIYIISEDKK